MTLRIFASFLGGLTPPAAQNDEGSHLNQSFLFELQVQYNEKSGMNIYRHVIYIMNRLSYRELHSNFGCGKFRDFHPDAVVVGFRMFKNS